DCKRSCAIPGNWEPMLHFWVTRLRRPAQNKYESASPFASDAITSAVGLLGTSRTHPFLSALLAISGHAFHHPPMTQSGHWLPHSQWYFEPIRWLCRMGGK